MGEIVQLRPNQDLAGALRRIADEYDDGDYEGDNATLVIGIDVFHIGDTLEEYAAQQAVFNLEVAKSRMMHAVNKAIDEETL